MSFSRLLLSYYALVAVAFFLLPHSALPLNSRFAVTTALSLPLLYIFVTVLWPFYWHTVHHEVTLDYWDEVYKKQYGVSGVNLGKRGETPPVYPNGWYRLCTSSDLAKGAVKTVRFMGEDLVLFRGFDGRVGCLSAYCPHLGAHLGVGGTVTDDNCLQCPFHGWKMDTSGKCVEIPYADGAPPPAQARTGSYKVQETHRAILIWFDAEGRDPTYELSDAFPSIPDNFVFEGTAIHHIPCHISEVSENGADIAHLNFLHTPVHPAIRFAASLLPMKFVWSATWEVNKKNPCITDMTLTERFHMFNRQFNLIGADAVIAQVGPGMVILQLETAFGQVILFQSLTPMEPYHQRLETTMYCSPNLLNMRIFNHLVLKLYAENVERDVMIWGKKQYVPQAILARGDGPIQRFRKWFSQFYSPNSPTWESIKEKERLQEMRREATNW